MVQFTDLGLSSSMIEALTRLKFSTATPIQAAAIPPALSGRDILGTAQTGTGKTAAFGLPLLEHITIDPKHHRALVLTPTRELATQVHKALESFIAPKQKIRTALLIGGQAYKYQIQALQRKPAILIGTPGRLNDHVNQGNLALTGVTFLVFDEIDRMLDMGFSTQIDALVERMRAPIGKVNEGPGSSHKPQTLMFSATLPAEIEQLAKTYLTNPARVCVGTPSQAHEDVTQKTLFLSQDKKLAAVKEILETQEGSAVVFVRTKYGVERTAKALADQGITASALHGDLRQRKRDQVTLGFRKGKFRVLVATDVAARGLDIPHLSLVINHDLPQVAEDYIHRIGRTARAGSKGHAFSFVSPSEKHLWTAITRLLNFKTNKKNSKTDLPKSRRSFARNSEAGHKKGRRPRTKAESWDPVSAGQIKKKHKGPSNKRKTAKGPSIDPSADSKPKQRRRNKAALRDKGKPAWAGKK